MSKSLSWWTSDWMIFFLRRWVDESESIHEWPDGRMNYGWMSELLFCCASFSLSDLFAEAPLLLATSSLSSLFSATSSLTLLWAFPGSSSIDSATQFFSSRSCYNAFSNFQLQSRLPGVATSVLCCAQPCQCVWSQTVANPHTMERRAKTTNVCVALTMGTRPHKSGAAPVVPAFCDFYVKPSSRYSLVHMLQAPSSKSALIPLFVILKWKPSSRYSPAHFSPTTFPDRAPNSRK